MLTLYEFRISPFCQKVRRILNYKKLDFKPIEVSPGRMVRMRPRNPVGKYPFLVDGEREIGDSTDIAYYLDEKYPERPIFPQDRLLRARMHVLEDWGDETLFFLEAYFRFASDRNRTVMEPLLREGKGAFAPLAWRVTARMLRGHLRGQGIGRKRYEHVLADFRRNLDALDALASQGPFLLGEAPTLGDFSIVSMLNCVRETTVEGAEFDAYPTVLSWMKRMDEAAPDPPR